MLSDLWRSGLVRLGALTLVIVAAVAVLSATDEDPRPPTPDEKAAAERRELREIENARQRKEAARRRDPVVRREVARLREEQKAHFGSGPRGQGSRAKQETLVAALERSITRDARSRFAKGKLNRAARDTVCVHLVRPNTPKPPPPPLHATEAGYECTAVTTRVGATSRTDPAIIGFPFWARVNFRTGRYAWCKVNLMPSEGGIGGSLAEVPLPPICDVLEKGPA